jgi:dCTP deaminase
LITDGFVDRNVKQACYELRVGDVYYDLSANSARHEVRPGGYVLIKPRQLVVVITAERLHLPNDMLGRILTKGHLFSLGLLPVNTYADPGFCGRLGIVLHNVSDNYLKLPVSEPVAKIEFARLPRPVSMPYRGQHGYETQIWPLRNDLILTEDEIARDPRVGDVAEEIQLTHGRHIGKIVEHVLKHQRNLLIVTLLYSAATVALVGMVATTGWSSQLVGFGLGIVGNLVAAGITFRATRLGRRKCS